MQHVHHEHHPRHVQPTTMPGGGDGAKTPARSLSMTTGTLYSPRAAAVGPHVSGGSGGKSQKGNRNEKTSHDG